MSFEQGPIRPPSEAHSLLVRVSRNCPWNRCTFCPVYKGSRFSTRTVEEIIQDLDEMLDLYGDRPRTVFLQDANPVLAKPDDLIAVLDAIRERFPGVERVTAYARSNTLARRKVDDLRRIREAGLHRLHVGLESGCDAVLSLVDKGVTRDQQIEGGRRARAAGFELSEYVMPGLGGRALSDSHADDTASAICAIEPDFVRVRSTVVVPGTGLAELREGGRFESLSEVETVAELRRFLAGLEGVATRLESDHSMNLLMELRGSLPGQLDTLIDVCDRFLGLSESDRRLFVLGRRLGWVGRLSHMEDDGLRGRIEGFEAELLTRGIDPLTAAAELRMMTV